MVTSKSYILIGVVVLAIIIIVLGIFKNKKPGKKMSKLTTVSFIFVILGIVMGGDSRFSGYSLMGIGIIVAIIDIIMKRRSGENLNK